jgi:hypothetical protein
MVAPNWQRRDDLSIVPKGGWLLVAEGHEALRPQWSPSGQCHGQQKHGIGLL